MRTLTMTFDMESGSTKTYTLQDPRADLTQDEVRATMQKMIAKKAVAVGEDHPTGIKDAYIRVSDREELA